MSQNARLELRRMFWDIRRQLLARFDYLVHLKLEPGHLFGGELASYGRPRKNTIVYADALLAETPSTQRAVLWHNMGLALYEHFQPEEPEDYECIAAAESCINENRRIARFLNSLKIGPNHEQQEQHQPAPMPPSVATKAERGAGAT